MHSANPPKRGIRVALVGLPSMLRDIIAALIADQPDMEMVPAQPEADLVSVVHETGANVVIVGMEKDRLPLAYRESLGVLAQIRVLGVTERGNRAVLYRMILDTIDMSDVSPQDLLAATRTTASPTQVPE